MKTIIGAFDDTAQADNAARALVNTGVSRDDISVIANNESGTYANPVAGSTETVTTAGHAVGHDAKVGAEWGAVTGLLLGATALAIPGLGWIAAAGWFGGMILGAGTGAIIGGLVGRSHMSVFRMTMPFTTPKQYGVAVCCLQYAQTMIRLRRWQ